MLLVFQMMVLWLHKVLLQLQFSSHPAIVGAAHTAIIAAQSAVGAASAANGPVPASDGASSASMDFDAAAVGTTSAQAAASPT